MKQSTVQISAITPMLSSARLLDDRCGDAMTSHTHRSGTITLRATVLAALLIATSSSAQTLFREHRLTDPGMHGAVASTLLVPEGWHVEGGLSRPSDRLYSMPVVADVKVTAPDRRQVRFYPSLSFDFDHASPGVPLQPTLGGNLYLPLPDSPGRWFMDMARRSPDPSISGLQLVSESDVPELTAQLRQRSAGLMQILADGNRTTAGMGFQTAFDTQATRLDLRYVQNGQALEETVVMSWQYQVLVRQGQAVSGSWAILQMRSVSGPAGTPFLEDPVLAAIVASVRNDPAWEAEMNRYWAEIARIRQRGQQQRQAQFAAHNRRMREINQEIGNIIVGGYQRREAIRDASHARTVDAIREVTPYQTSGGQTVKLPSFYDHVYTDNNGRYILHNDAGYEPNIDRTINNVRWQRIEPQR
ncbi:MAG: hypothetical protein AB7G13_25975 [Lautropia sp.]